ncbi:MAG: UDP-glucose/GDP-mannose dehydrogenase family protein [Candidatus Gygaella obscura]|nr:UDP-glucose/GDP-mannose dehydrogenase family protein [Candidatus Gygaella obscura]
MKVGVIGTGYVGLVTGTCFANLGNYVICADNDKKKIDSLVKGKIPIYEPGLDEMVVHNAKLKRLSFTTSIKKVVDNCEIIFIAVGTPAKKNGEADLSFVKAVAKQIAKYLFSYKVIVEKSTVPVETGELVKRMIARYTRKNIEFDVASNPEFLREGTAIKDFLNPDRIVIGVSSKRAENLLKKLYASLKAPILVTDVKSAEIIKHASNSFLATKISFINAVSNICEKVNADILKVAEGMGMDKRIGKQFLSAGIGFGGSCFPKDVDAFINISKKLGYDFGLLEEVRRVNKRQIEVFVSKIRSNLKVLKNKTIGLLGLAFKPETDDMREAASLKVIDWLKTRNVKVKVFDPKAMPRTKTILKGVKFCKDAYELAKGCDCILIITEWDEFKQLDLSRIKKVMKQSLIIDGRNIFDQKMLKKAGFKYISTGRGRQ